MVKKTLIGNKLSLGIDVNEDSSFSWYIVVTSDMQIQHAEFSEERFETFHQAMISGQAEFDRRLKRSRIV